MDSTLMPVTIFTPAAAGERRAVDFQRNLAVVIGINDYVNGIARLTTAANDARRLTALLQTDYGYETHLVTSEATKARLTHLFQGQLPAEVGTDDRLLVYFAGHGIALDGDDGPTGYLVPQDGAATDRASFLSMTEFHGWLEALPCRHLLVILDCCFAGAFRWASTRHLISLPPVLHKERYDRFIQSPAWQVLTSAAYDQTALDLLAGDLKRGLTAAATDCHSPFATALFQALAGAADLAPQGRGDGVITATELYLYLRDAVEVRADQEANHQQTPGLWPLKKQRKGEFIFLPPGHKLNLPPAPALTAEANPYRGLQPYERQHAKLFFGRERQTAQLAAVVTAQPLTIVLGASGTGKSSLVKAGLLPFLQAADDGTPTDQRWLLLDPMRPGDTPLRTLERLLQTALTPTGASTVDPVPLPAAPASGDLGAAILPLLTAWLTNHPQRRLLLVVDQVEELITQAHDEAEARTFQQVLAQALAAHPQQLRLVLTLRTDFEPQFAQSPLAPAWQAGRYVVPPLTQAELRAVIEGPASERVLYFEPPELVDRLIDEVIQTPGALPLLSFTLSEMYIHYVTSGSDQRALTQAHYDALGGVIGSLRVRATQEYEGLPDEAHRATMRRIMLRMVSTEGGELARRRVPLFELKYSTAAENERVTHVIERLVEARLLVRDSSDLNADGVVDSYVEPAHDALVRAWDQLLSWQRAAALYLPVQRRLTQAAGAWQQAADRDKAGLLWDNDPALPQVLPKIIQQADALDLFLNPLQTLWPAAAVDGLPDWLNAIETEFTRQSVRQRAIIRRRIVSITLAVMIALATIALVALRNATVSRSNTLAANAQLAIQNKDYDLAIALALAANNIFRPPTLARNTLAAAAYVPGTEIYYKAHDADVTGVALSPDGRYAVSGSLDGSAVVWDRTAQTITQRLDASQIVSVTSVAYSPTEQQALLGLGNGDLVIWDVESGAIRQRWQQPQEVSATAYTPDGQHVLVGDRNGALTLWAVAGGVPVLSLPSQRSWITALAISPDGSTALSGARDGTLVLWDLATGAQLREFEGLQDRVFNVAYGPQTGYITAGSRDRNVGVWNMQTGQAEGGFPLSEHTQQIGSIAASPTGSTLASGAWDGSILLWNSAWNGGLIRAFVGHRAPVISLAYSHDGRHLLSGSKDGVVRLWDSSGPAQLKRLLVESVLSGASIEPVRNLAIDLARQRVLSASLGALTLWRFEPENQQTMGEVLQRFDLRTTAAVLRDALVFQVKAYDPAIGNQDGAGIAQVEFIILDAAGQVVYRKQEAAAGYCAFGGGAPDCGVWRFANRGYRWPGTENQPGARIVSGHYTLRAIVHAEDGRKKTINAVIELRLSDPVGPYQPIRIVDTAGAQELVAEIVQTGALPNRLLSVALSPDGQTALSGANGDLILWDLSTGAAIRHLDGHQSQVLTIQYSPDSATALTAAEDGLILQWQLATGEQQRACDIADQRVWNIALSQDGTLALAGDEERNVVLWDLTRCRLRQRFVGHQDAVYWVAISQDKRTVLTGSADRRVILWDAATGQPIRRFEGHTLPVRAVAYSPDGQTLLSGGEDKTVRLWDLATGAERFRFEGHATTIQQVLYIPDQAQLLSRAGDGSLILWELPPTQLEALRTFAYDRRYVRSLTCDERTLYNVKPLCTQQ